MKDTHERAEEILAELCLPQTELLLKFMANPLITDCLIKRS